MPAYVWRFQYFAYVPAYADLPITGFYLRAQSYDHLPSYHMKGGLYIRAAKFTKNKNDQWNHAGGFATTISTSLSLKM